MAENYYSILTSIGKAQIANALGLGIKVDFVKMKVGDGNGSYYNPTESQTDLVHTVWEGAIGHVAIDEDNPNWINIEVLIPPDIGGFMIREYAVFDANNNMLAIAKCAETYKPLPADGSTKEINMKMVLAISNTSTITLKIDPTIMFAKKKDVDEVSTRVDQLSTSINNINASLSDLTNDRIYYCGTTSGTNTYTATNSRITAYTDSLTVRIKIGTASTGASTLNINGLGAKTILDTLGNAITSGGLKAGLPYQLSYNGTNFIVLGKGGGGNATADKILAPYNATNDTGQITGTMPNHTGADSPANSIAGTGPGRIYVRPQYGYYDGSVASYVDDANFIAANIISGINVFGVAGSATTESLGGVKYATGPLSGSVTLSFTPRLVIINNGGRLIVLLTNSFGLGIAIGMWDVRSTADKSVMGMYNYIDHQPSGYISGYVVGNVIYGSGTYWAFA